MKMLEDSELNLVNGGRFGYSTDTLEQYAEKREKLRREEWLQWVNQEKQRLQGIADMRLRAAEEDMKAAVRENRVAMGLD